MPENEALLETYQLLLARFGSQNWWPAETSFEIIVGAILTQQSRWSSIEKSIRNLKEEGLLEPEALSRSSLARATSSRNTKAIWASFLERTLRRSETSFYCWAELDRRLLTQYSCTLEPSPCLSSMPTRLDSANVSV